MYSDLYHFIIKSLDFFFLLWLLISSASSHILFYLHVLLCVHVYILTYAWAHMCWECRCMENSSVNKDAHCQAKFDYLSAVFETHMLEK